MSKTLMCTEITLILVKVQILKFCIANQLRGDVNLPCDPHFQKEGATEEMKVGVKQEPVNKVSRK